MPVNALQAHLPRSRPGTALIRRRRLWARLWRAYPQSLGVGRHDGSLDQILSIKAEHMKANRGLLSGRDVHQPNDPGVGHPLNNGEFTEVLIEGHEDPLISVSLIEDLHVSGVRVPVSDRDDVMSPGQELLPGSSPDAAIQEEPHPSVPVGIRSGSTRS